MTQSYSLKSEIQPVGERKTAIVAPDFGHHVNICVRDLDLNLMPQRDSNDEIEQKTDWTEHERQHQTRDKEQMADPEGLGIAETPSCQ